MHDYPSYISPLFFQNKHKVQVSICLCCLSLSLANDAVDISENVKELNIITISAWNQKFMVVTHANTVEPTCAKHEMWEFEIIFFVRVVPQTPTLLYFRANFSNLTRCTWFHVRNCRCGILRAFILQVKKKPRKSGMSNHIIAILSMLFCDISVPKFLHRVTCVHNCFDKDMTVNLPSRHITSKIKRVCPSENTSAEWNSNTFIWHCL